LFSEEGGVVNQEEQNQFVMMSAAIRDCALAGDAKRIFARVKRFLREFTDGAEHDSHHKGVLGIFQLKSQDLNEAQRLTVTNWSSDYIQLRREMNDYAHDPAIILSHQSTAPFTWQKAMMNADRRARQVADLCAEHTGQKHGLTFPIADINMRKGAGTIGFDLDPSHFSPTQIGMMHHVLTSAYARLYKVMGPFPEDVEPDYSPRQREVVRLLALGMTTRSAAAALQVSEATVKHHVRAAMAKVNAHTSAQLIAKSINKNVVLI
jgi:LuxR family quorum sensing-dependent transcriptional regulator